MSVITNNLLLTSGDEGGYTISRSVRLRSSASAYLNRTYGTATTQNTFTLSFWMKRGKLSSFQTTFGATNVNFDGLSINSSDQIVIYANNIAALTTTAVYRDPAAWYHIVLSHSNTSNTLYVNGVSAGTGTFSLPIINTAISHAIGQNGGGNYFDGYLTEINFIDGQALTPSSFGETDTITGVWKPKAFSGTYGTNGFYLNFSDNSAATAAAIGNDSSGNGNNWTPNNISVTAGSTYDSMLDTPTPYADGGNGRGNYATLNPLLYSSSYGYRTLSNGNLSTVGNSATNNGNDFSTQTIITGKWYAEFTCTGTTGTYPQAGLISVASAGSGAGQVGYVSNSVAYFSDGTKQINNVQTSYGNSYTTGSVIGVAVDADNGAIYFSKDGVFQNSGVPTSGASRTGAAWTWTGGSIEFYIGSAVYTSSSGWNANFGQRPFSSTPPTGFKALNTQNLPDATIKKGSAYFDAVTWTGNGSAGRAITTNVGTVDFAWVKLRSGADDHRLANTVTGGNKHLKSNATDAESTGTNVIQSFSGSTFTVGSDVSVNGNGSTYVGWVWQAGGTAVTNTSGSITSSVSANTTAGFSIVTYTGTGSAATVGHGLGVAPKLIIGKKRSSTGSWQTYVSAITNMANGYIVLNSGGGWISASTIWNGTAPTSTVFSLGTDTDLNASGATNVAYCFAEVAGYSKFGSYTGNGSTDGTFVYTGFRPKFVLFKRSDSTGEWGMWDTGRNTYNVSTSRLSANSAGAELNQAATNIDILSNGFKFRTSDSDVNANGSTYIYAAFAENPFKNSLAR